MSKFCTQCGTPLEDGKCPKCVKKETKEEKKEVGNKEIPVKEDRKVSREYPDYSKPVDCVDTYLEKSNSDKSIILTVVASLLMGFLYVDIITLSSRYLPYVNMSSYVCFRSFVIYSILFFMLIILFNLIIYLLTKYLIKEDISIMELIDITGISLVAPLIGLIVAILGFSFGSYFGMIFLLGSLICFSICYCYGLYKKLQDKNKVIILFLIGMLLTSFLVVLF